VRTSAAAVASYAIATAACVIGVHFADAGLFRVLPFADADKLVWLAGLAMPDGQPWRLRSLEALAPFEAVALFRAGRTVVTLPSGELEADVVETVGHFDRVFQTTLSHGRPAQPDSSEVVVARPFWDSMPESSRSLGVSIRIDGRTFSVVGVSRDSLFPLRASIWIPTLDFSSRSIHLHSIQRRPDATATRHMVARLRGGWSTMAAREAVLSVQQRWEDSRPESRSFVGVIRLDAVVTREVIPTLTLLLTSLGLVIAASLTNVALFALLHRYSREREIAIRLALGATPLRVSMELLWEALQLSLSGVLIGAILTLPLLSLFIRAAAAEFAALGSRISVLAIASPAILIVIGPLLVVVLALGSWQWRSRLPIHGLRAGPGLPARTHRASVVVNALQVALAVALATTALISMQYTLRITSRYTNDMVREGRTPILEVLIAPEIKHPADVLLTLKSVLEHHFAMRGIGVTTYFPLASDVRMSWTVLGQADPTAGGLCYCSYVDNEMLTVLGISLVTGRLIDRGDVELGRRVALVGDYTALRAWPHGALGRMVELDGHSLEVVGVVHTRRFAVGEDYGRPVQLYVPVSLTEDRRFWLAPAPGFGYNEADSGALASVARSSGVPATVASVTTARRIVADVLWPARAQAFALAALGGTAVVMAILGTAALATYLAYRALPSTAIRLAVGATPLQVAIADARAGLLPTASGASLGFTVVAWAAPVLARATESMDVASPFAWALAGSGVAMITSAVWLSTHFVVAHWAGSSRQVHLRS